VTVEVRHRIAGPEDAPVLVFSNSLGTTSEMWDEQAAALGDRFRILRYETRGHGGSPAPPGPYSIADLGADVIALLDRLEIRRASFCGLSIGGMTGLWLGASAADRLEALAVCCTGARLPPPEMWADRAAKVRAEGVAGLVEATIERWFRPEFIEANPAAIERVRATFLTTDPEGYASCCEALAGSDMRGELGRVTPSTLIVAGSDDPVGTPERARELESGIPEARLVTLAARHLAAVEQPHAFTEALGEHLDANRSATEPSAASPSEWARK
jgi:3-oxoadipate enol-lactonase